MGLILFKRSADAAREPAVVYVGFAHLLFRCHYLQGSFRESGEFETAHRCRGFQPSTVVLENVAGITLAAAGSTS